MTAFTLPTCPICDQTDYLPIGRGWRRCWACGRRWGPPGTPDPGDPPDLVQLAALLGLRGGSVPRQPTAPLSARSVAREGPQRREWPAGPAAGDHRGVGRHWWHGAGRSGLRSG